MLLLEAIMAKWTLEEHRIRPRIARVASGGAWYHEEAMQKAERARKA
jgi:hypothetical protein